MAGQNYLTFAAGTARLEFSDSGTMRPFDGIQGLSVTTTEAPTTDRSSFLGQSSTVGSKPLETITFTVDSYQPYLTCWRIARERSIDNGNMTLRFTSDEQEFFVPPSTGRAAIATTGIVTLSDTGSGTVPDLSSSEFPGGIAIKIGTDIYPIDYNLSDSTAQTIYTLSGQVSAAAYSFVIPALSIGGTSGFICKVTSTNDPTITVGEPVTGSLSVAPISRLTSLEPLQKPSTATLRAK